MSYGVLPIALGIVVAGWAILVAAFWRELARLWREPVLRFPVVIIESDDWGPGPEAHAECLRQIAECLAKHTDITGRPAMMSIGVVLAAPDNTAMREAGDRAYQRQTLAQRRYASIREALESGRRQRTFALQLHGMEHLWPDTLVALLAAGDSETKAWFDRDPGTGTEGLPSHVQSRWTDARKLPSNPLDAAEIRLAAGEEVATFKTILGIPARTVVPPTFLWTNDVELAWAANGVQTLITPGRRSTLRDGTGRPAGYDRSYHNGQASDGGLTCLVRDIYFEPALGHCVPDTCERVSERVWLGRPALLETHRFNFTGAPEEASMSLQALDHLLTQVRSRCPDVRYLSPEELAQGYRARDPALFVTAVPSRIVYFVRRAARISRLRKLAWASGLGVLVALIHSILSRMTRTPSSV